MKKQTVLLLATCLGLQFFANLATAGVCDEPTRAGEICRKMRHLRTQIHALDAQRELMQFNADYLKAMGTSLNSSATQILKEMGIGIPEHQMGLSQVAQLGTQIAGQAAHGDPAVLASANQVRTKCATCHATTNPAGGVSWDNIFRNDWLAIAAQCAASGKNPYLCRSMNGLLSTYGYMLTEKSTGLLDYPMTEQAALEVVRILDDLKAKNFSHLPENLRLQAVRSAGEVARLAANRDPLAFDKAETIAQSCMQCHTQNHGRPY